jgi:hypothetical protein
MRDPQLSDALNLLLESVIHHCGYDDDTLKDIDSGSGYNPEAGIIRFLGRLGILTIVYDNGARVIARRHAKPKNKSPR